MLKIQVVGVKCARNGMDPPQNLEDPSMQDAWKAFYAMWTAKEQAVRPTTSSNLSGQIDVTPGTSARGSGHEEHRLDDSAGEDEPSRPGSESQSEPECKSPDTGSDSQPLQLKQTKALEPGTSKQTEAMEPGILEYFSTKTNKKRDRFRISLSNFN